MANKRGRPRKVTESPAKVEEAKATPPSFAEIQASRARKEMEEVVSVQKSLEQQGVDKFANLANHQRKMEALAAEKVDKGPDQGLGPDDRLDEVAASSGYPLPEDPRVALPASERTNIFVQPVEPPEAKTQLEAWEQASGTKPAVAVPIGTFASEKPMITTSGDAVAGIKKGELSGEEKKADNVAQNKRMFDESIMEENAKPIYLQGVGSGGMSIVDHDPISRALGLQGFVENQTWDWLATTPKFKGDLGVQFSVSRYYWQVPPLKLPLAIDIFSSPFGPQQELEIQIKQTIFSTRGIVYWPLRPGQSINRTMRDLVMMTAEEVKQREKALLEQAIAKESQLAQEIAARNV
jgi:hypothetical protein